MKNFILFLSLMISTYLVSGQAALRVVNSGNVGIGINNPVEKLDVDGNIKSRGTKLDLGSGQGTNTVTLNIGGSRAGDGTATFDLVSDWSQYAAYGFRFQRSGNGTTIMTHRGTKPFTMKCQEAGADFRFATSNIERMRIEDNGEIGIGVTNPTALLDVGGDIKMNGDLVLTSDKRLKKNEKAFNAGLEEVMKLRPIQYTYNGKANTSNDDKEHVGLYAQELQKIVPDLVSEFLYQKEDEDGNIIEEDTYLQINDTGIKYLLINAIQEQQSMINRQEEAIAKLTEQMTSLLQTLDQNNSNETKVELQGTALSTLGQNSPNPFDEVTSIDYSIASDANGAVINVFNIQGQLIKEIAVSGTGTISLDRGTLPKGQYMYSLIVDGNVLETKKMAVVR